MNSYPRPPRCFSAARDEAEGDAAAARTLWIVTALALTIMIGLFAREARLRRVLQRLVQLLMGRGEGKAP